jgi:hypothetical protein
MNLSASLLKIRKLKSYKSSDHFEVLEIERNEHRTDLAAGERNQDVVDERNLLAPKVRPPEAYPDSHQASLLPIVINRIHYPSDTLKGAKEVLNPPQGTLVHTSDDKVLGYDAGKESGGKVPPVLLRML